MKSRWAKILNDEAPRIVIIPTAIGEPVQESLLG